MPRPDAQLIKHIYAEHGQHTAREWQRPPLVILPGAELVQHLVGEDGPTELNHLPWEDAVYDLGPLRDLVDEFPRGYAWIRVRTLEQYEADIKRSSPWMWGPAVLTEPYHDDAERWLVAEAWEDNVEVPGRADAGLPFWPDVVVLDRRGDDHGYLYPNPDCRGDRAHGFGFCSLDLCRHHDLRMPCIGSHAMMTLWSAVVPRLIGYLAQTPDHPVEVRPAAPRTPKAAKTAKKKPWLAEHPHVIMIDPTRVREYGHPSGGGTHASPRPHQRRGHWRRLEHPRFGQPRAVFVRSAWVGAAEWQHEGAIYRVFLPG
jgi:hypothetical protein